MLYRMMPSPVSDVGRGLDDKPPRILDTAHDPRARTVAQAVAEIQGVERVLLFGSRARGDYRPHSDIDLLVVVPPHQRRPDTIGEIADRAVRRGYGDWGPDVDVTILASDFFEFMQHGLNHVAAQAARDGVTTRGFRYRPPTGGEQVPKPSDEHRSRETMERAWTARRNLLAMRLIFQAGSEAFPEPAAWESEMGEKAQHALEHACKAVIAAHGRAFPHTHTLESLHQYVRNLVPRLTLTADLEGLSDFAGPEAYGNPDLEQDPETMVQAVIADMEAMLNHCGRMGGFDPWTFTKDDYRRT